MRLTKINNYKLSIVVYLIPLRLKNIKQRFNMNQTMAQIHLNTNQSLNVSKKHLVLCLIFYRLA